LWDGDAQGVGREVWEIEGGQEGVDAWLCFKDSGAMRNSSAKRISKGIYQFDEM